MIRLNSRSQIPDPRPQIPDSRLQIPDPRPQTPDPRLQTPDSRIQTPDPRSQDSDSTRANVEKRHICDIMACLKLKMTRIILMSIVFLCSVRRGRGLCRPVCADRECVTVNQDRVDFKTAEKACSDRSGELLPLHPQTHVSLLDNLRQQLSGNFWIGLRLPAGTCSDLSSPLRGYEWLSGSTNGSFIPSSVTWKHSVKVCSPSCVSLSEDQKWTERLCSDTTDGYLCRTEHYDACLAQEVSDPQVFRSSKGCLTGPCEHECTDVTGGYKCSCFPGYIPDSGDPRRCKMHCGKHRCPKICDEHDAYACLCPDGYIMVNTGTDYDDFFCEDIDECEGAWVCDQNCKNTFGGYECSCRDGFVLKDHHRCIQSDNQSSNRKTLKKTSAPAGHFLWLWVFVAVPVVMLMCVVRFCDVQHQKSRLKLDNGEINVLI
nr:thrombomodulin-like [Solea senegalensis]